jgi:hypothetical protein
LTITPLIRTVPTNGSTAPPVAVTRAVVEVEQGDRASGAQTGLRRGRRRPDTRVSPAEARARNPESLDPLHDLVPHIGFNGCPLNGGNRHGALARPASPGGVQRLRQVQLLSAASGN